jgi:transcriptional regulator with XRE-family HTH domain
MSIPKVSKRKSIPKVSKTTSIPKVSIRQVKAARVLLQWSQEDLASAANFSVATLKRIEAADGDLGGRPNTSHKLLQALNRAGIEFIQQNGGGPGVRLKRPYPRIVVAKRAVIR